MPNLNEIWIDGPVGEAEAWAIHREFELRDEAWQSRAIGLGEYVDTWIRRYKELVDQLFDYKAREEQ